jgi:hypothetical protein
VAYLVVCEAVTNALKHAGADTITVDVAIGDGRAEVTVVDDGCGGADLRAGTGLVARAGSPRVGTAGLVLTFAGFSGLSFSGAGYDAAAIAARQAGLDLATTQKVLERIDALQAPAIGAGVLVPLMFAGVILLGVALWRGRAVPRWAALATLIAPPVSWRADTPPCRLTPWGGPCWQPGSPRPGSRTRVTGESFLSAPRAIRIRRT